MDAAVTVTVAAAGDLPEVYALRHEVFVLGQDVPPDLERDALDDVAVHGAARRGGVLVGTGRLLAPGLAAERAVVGRMAVAAASRGSGVGAALLALLEREAAARGWTALELHAQVHARGFYDRAGWTAHGPVYLEAGIDHVDMRKDLPTV